MEAKIVKYKSGGKWKSVDLGENFITHWERYLDEKLNHFNSHYKRGLCTRASINDFSFGRTIGFGATGKIVLATLNDNKNELFAIKITDKERTVNKGHVNHVNNEKRILQSLNFPFVINLEMFFHDNSYLYFVMPFVQGGDMFSLMRHVVRFSEDEAKFYAAQIVLALEYLHYMGVVHRDIKPENILLTQTGYVKIGDFGFAKVLPKIHGRTFTFCGTIDYISPEVIEAQGYGFSTDWWSLGIVIYEMCCGCSPYISDTPTEIYEEILACDFELPSLFSVDLCNLLTNLLQHDISKRFGCTWKGVNAIKEASWFKSIDWLAIVNKKVTPPYIPQINEPYDDSLFESYSNLKLSIAPKDKYKKKFRNICYK